MSMQFVISKQFQLGGKSFAENRNVNGGLGLVREASLAAAISGTVAAAMTSTTSTTTTLPPGGSQSGTLNLSTVAGLAIGQRLDVYWSGGSLYGATIEDLVGTNIFFNGGTLWSTGTAFPSTSTAITAMVPTSLPLVFTGNNLQAIVMYGDSGGTFIFDTATPTDAYANVLPTNASCKHWATGDSISNPCSGVAITQVFISHGDATGSKTMRVGALVNP